jgi:hypothetical protein
MPNKSEIPIATIKAVKAYKIIDFFGLYSGAIAARTTQQAKTSSTIILQAKALEVINGKNKLLKTRNGIKGTQNNPPTTIHHKVFLFI